MGNGDADADVRLEVNWPRDGVVERMHVDDRGLEGMHEVARAAGSLSVGGRGGLGRSSSGG